MTDDLISRLRERYTTELEQEAADALEAQARELDAKCKECSELKVELAKWVNYWRDKDNKALQTRIAELEAALKPFADCGVWDGYKDEEVFKLGFKIADLRAARAALGDKE